MKNTKKIIILSTIIIFLISTFVVKAESKEISQNSKKEDEKKITYIENTQSYETEKGTHTIYWTQGITPPKMTNDPNLLGTKGYFSLDKTGDFETYSAEFEPGKGYFDYNKNLDDRYNEYSLCYLGASSNLISWWLEQNKLYVEKYLDRLKTTNIYGQQEGLYKILPFNQKMWDEIKSDPGIEIQQGYKAQKLGKSPLVTKYLEPYYKKTDEGYYVDMVIDFFFNGYEAIPKDRYFEANTEEFYKKDQRGGFFFPLLGKKQITKRLEGGIYNTYDYIDKNLRKMFAEGKGVTFGYEIGHAKAHAITIWGAEYDENNKLQRVFITDSDDSQASKYNDEYWRGMVGLNTVEAQNGKMCLTNNTKPNKEKPGNYVIAVTTVDLAKDILEERLNDIEPPKKPEILKQPEDKILAYGAKRDVEVKAQSIDNGIIEYEWYVSNDKNSKGTKINKEDKSTFTIPTNEYGEKYYYCVIKNIKNGKTETEETRHFKIDIQNIKITNAETPKIKFDYKTTTYNQYDAPCSPEIKVDASVQDKGTITYQWYQSNDNTPENGRKLEGETNPVIYPPTNTPTDGLFYYCEITNTKNDVSGNNKATIKTPYSKKIIVKPSELLEAKVPLIVSEPKNIKVNQFEKINPVKVEAKIFDGGTLSYQWYEVNDKNISTPIENEKNDTFIPNTNESGIKKYKCEIKNTNQNAKNKKESTIFTNIFTVEVKTDINISNDNNLKTLTITNAKLIPEFNPNITSYTANLNHEFEKVELSATANPKAKITIDNPIIQVGETKNININVEAEDKTTKIYTISVTRNKTHNFGQWQIIEEATCTKEGSKKRICAGCGYTEIEKILKLDHDWNQNWQIDKEPTCIEEGEKSHHCKNCEARKDITKIAKTKHQYGNWKTEKEATTTEKGRESRECKICKIKEYRDIKQKEENKEEQKEEQKEENKKEENKKEETKKPTNTENKKEEIKNTTINHDYLPKAGKEKNIKITIITIVILGVIGIIFIRTKKRNKNK